MSDIVDRFIFALRSAALKGQAVRSHHVIYAQEVAAECARLAAEVVKLREERDDAVAAVAYESGDSEAFKYHKALFEKLRAQSSEIGKLKEALSQALVPFDDMTDQFIAFVEARDAATETASPKACGMPVAVAAAGFKERSDDERDPNPYDDVQVNCPVCDGGPNGHTLSCPVLGVTPVLDLPTEPTEDADTSFQERVRPWMMACFGPEISSDRLERADRLVEEALELVQSGGYPRERVTALADYVYGREVGDPAQEVGGVMVTLAAYCLAHGLDMHDAGETELARIWTKVDAIRAKQAAKPTGSALPVPDAPETRAVGFITRDDLDELTAGNIVGHVFPAGTLRPENEVPVYLAPWARAMTAAQVETVARGIAKWLGFSWEGLGEGCVVEKGFPVFSHGQHGWSFQGRRGDMLALARDLLEEAR